MFYNRRGLLSREVPGRRLPRVEWRTKLNFPLELALSRILVPYGRYHLLVGRGTHLDWIGIKFDPEGEYKVTMNPKVCVLRIASHKATRDTVHEPAYEVSKNVLFVSLPPAKWELDTWWRRMPQVSDNPSSRRRRLVKVLGL